MDGFVARLGARAASLCLLLLFGAFASGQDEHVPNRVLVRFTSDPRSVDVQHALTLVQARLGREIPHTGYRLVELAPGVEARRAADFLRTQPGIRQVELDQLRAPDAIPNDPSYSSQWHLAKIACPTAWNTTQGSPSVVIAILDTGVDGAHPDLAGHLVAGWNCYDNNSNTADVYGHGTAVAGTASACTNNGIGVAGVAWNCSLMPVRICDPAGWATSTTTATALSWAADHGARVANISYEFNSDSVVASAAQYFMSKGGVVTMSAGNYSTVSTAPDNPYVVTVSASDGNDAIASWSNTGSNVDLAAPGVNITTTCNGGGYGGWSGTSFSAPVVGGVAALVISLRPDLSAQQVVSVLKQSADDLGAPGWDPNYGWGRVNAGKAVALALTYGKDTTPPVVSFVTPVNGAKVGGTVTVSVSATDGTAVDTVQISKDGVLVATLLSAPYNWSWDTTKDANGSHTLTATATDFAGNSATTSVSVTVSNSVDITPPTVTIVSPTGGQIGNAVYVYVNATDNVGVVKVELYVDGALTATSTTSPFTTRWNSRRAAPGSHTLQAKAYDAAGNSGWSQVVTVYK